MIDHVRRGCAVGSGMCNKPASACNMYIPFDYRYPWPSLLVMRMAELRRKEFSRVILVMLRVHHSQAKESWRSRGSTVAAICPFISDGTIQSVSNQVNLNKKSHQVSRVYEFYSVADRVLVWLGEATNTSDIALDLFHCIRQILH
jgi:hypothetical protein